jgi:signal transduction histidine kinase
MVKGAGAVLSKARNTRGVPSEVTEQVPPDASPSAGLDGSPPEMFPAANGSGQQPGGAPARRPRSLLALKDWRVRSRLLLLVVIPTVTAVAGGGIFIASSVQNALVYQRVQTLANLSGKITGLVQSLQDEREDTVQYIVLGYSDGGRGAPMSSALMTPPTQELKLLQQDYANTTGWADQVKAQAAGIGGSYSALAQEDAQAALTAIGNLPAIRTESTTSQLPAQIVINEYAAAIDQLLDVESQIAVGSSDSTLAGSVSALGLVSGMKEEASEQQALLTSALGSSLVTLGQFGPAQESALTDAQAQQQGDLNEFDTEASAAERQLYNSAMSASNIVQAQAQEQQAISLASSTSPIVTDPTISDASSSLGYVVGGLRSVEQQLASSVISRAGSLRDGAITSAILFTLAVALLLAIALVATTVVGRSMVGPLRRLRTGALNIAGERLPEMVRRMSETDGESIPLEVEPIDVDSSDEIGEVARAFDQVHREAVRLAANEAALRGNVNAMFVNLSRRSQSLVERQIRVITRLEQTEQDSKRLASLFLMDHLATRMRRNSENLLVLAGHELSRRWSRPVGLVDVLRAAVSEIDQYERVTLNVQPEISVRTEAVSDVVHLTAELVENATSFSAAETPVTIAAYLPSSGGALVEISDQGVGMNAEDMARANWRLDNPPVVDVAVSRRMGLFVVARLAARHGIRVRLRSVPTGGLIALMWLPDETITHDKGSSGPARPVAAASPKRVAAPGNDFSTSGGWDSFATPAPAPVREQVDKSDPGMQPFTGMPIRERGRSAAAGSLPTRPVDRLRATDQGADFRQRDEEPDWGGDQRGGQFPAAEPRSLFGAESSQPLRPEGGQPLRPEGAQPVRPESAQPFRPESAQPFRPEGAQPFRTESAQPLRPEGAQPFRAESVPSFRPNGGLPLRGDGGSADVGERMPAGEVTVPPADNPSDRDRLPIFESVESHWFNRGRPAIGRFDQSSDGWSSPADDGWRAAEVAQAPTADGTTTAGLPKRVPKANLVPGTAASEASGPASGTSPEPTPTRSAADIAGRYASYQDGIRQGRAAVSGGNPDNREGQTS